MPMTTSSLFARKMLGQPNYLLVAMAAAFVLAFIPGGAKWALDASSNDVRQWLPADDNAMHDLAWFTDHFGGEDFALVSWDGCTLGDSTQLEWLAKRLAPAPQVAARAGVNSELARRARWFARVLTGPQVIEQLMQPPVGLSYSAAIKRLDGALVGPVQRDAQGRTLGDDSRATGLLVYLSQEAMQDRRTTRAALETIVNVAATECHVDPATIHLGGPPVDNVAIDAEGRRTLISLSAVAGALSVGLCYWRLRSVRLTALAVAAAAACAGMSLAIVYYVGAGEVLFSGRRAPEWGKLDALLMAMPPIVYLLALSCALHAINYYFDGRREHKLPGAAEGLVRRSWPPCMIAAVTTAAALMALMASHLFPIQKFALFTAISVVVSVGVVLLALPAALHRFPPSALAVDAWFVRRERSRTAMAMRRLVQAVTRQSAGSLACWAVILAVGGAGMLRLTSSVQIAKLLDRDVDLVRDYAWFEDNLGPLVPMEVVLTIPPERLRSGDEHAEYDGQQYRLTMLERIELLREIQRRLDDVAAVGRAMSAADFAPPSTNTAFRGANRGGDHAKNKALEAHRDLLLAGDYLRLERQPKSDRLTGRELWRLSARVAALSAGKSGVDYAELVDQVKRAVDPVLLAYQQRDSIVRELHERGKQLAGARVCVLFRAPDHASSPPADVQERTLADLLTKSGAAPRGVSYFNLAVYEQPNRGTAANDDLYRQAALNSLRQQDAVVLASASSDPTARDIANDGVRVVDVASLPSAAESTAVPLTDHGGPRPIRAVFTGMAPLVEQAQRQLLSSLYRGVVWSVGLVAVVQVLTMASVPAGFLVMAPVLLPLLVTFGTMGWLGVKVDLGLLMTAGVALGAAVDGAIHFTTWFRRCSAIGRSRQDAVLQAFDRCAPAMIEIALIAGIGLSVFGFSAFTPTRQLGYLMAAMLGASLVGNLLMLPAMLASPLGWFFAPRSVRRADPIWSRLAFRLASAWSSVVPKRGIQETSAPPPHRPHFIDEPALGHRLAPTAQGDVRRELAEGPHAALHAKLQKLRRSPTGDSPAS
jgi:predicted RND superfamily exporter protein